MIWRLFSLLGGAAVIVGAIVLAGWLEPSDPTDRRTAPLSRSAAARSVQLAEARRSMRRDDVDAFIKAQRALTAEQPTVAEHWRVLAEAHLERALLESSHRGMAVGKAVYTALPEAVRQHADLGEAALTRARELGDASSESYRIEAALTTLRITGVATAIRLDAAVRSAIDTASKLDPENPRAVVAKACRSLFKPSWLGGDPGSALGELLLAADALPNDERPLMFASMAAYLEGDTTRATDLMRRCVERNPANRYAAAVLGRLERGEDEPFARDVGA